MPIARRTAGLSRLFWTLVLVACLPQAKAFLPPDTRLENYDKRAHAPAAITPERQAAARQLQATVRDAKVDFDPLTGSPKWVRAEKGFLSGPGGTGRGISAASLAAVPPNEPHRALKAFLNQHAKLFGHGAEALDSASVKREFTTAHNGLKTVVWEQQLDGIPVFEGLLVAHTTKADELVSVSSAFVPDHARAADRATPNRALLQSHPAISGAQAVVLAAKDVGETLSSEEVSPVEAQPEGPTHRQHFRAPKLNDETDAQLVWLPLDGTRLRLCWQVILTSRSRGEMFQIVLDAQTGEALVRHCLTDYLTEATYRVYTSDSPSPFSPGYSTPTTTQPPLVTRSLVTLSALDTNASPNGWIDDGGNETRGNNVDAHTDRNDDDQPDLPRPQGSPFRVFDFTLDLAQQPTTYSSAAVVQLFYWNNFIHDKLFALGFTEAAGNFQSNNFGRGGLGNDAVQADAQDGGGYNNANFSTPPDGSPGRMQMYIFNGMTPNRDGDLDAEVVLHEYTHGLSNRRVGGGIGMSALQSEGMGEGWSDFYALCLLSEAADDVDGVYASGAYVSYLIGSGYYQNYYFGIRRYPYCTDMSKNPLTFKDIDPAQASSHPGVPRSPIVGSTANEVHNMGEVWCVTLWEARANLVHKYGWAVGNQLILQLVTDAMNLSPGNPTFLQARDAILQADQVNSGGANLPDLWTAFAKRGMGIGATSPASTTTTGVHESFDLPDALQITPGQGFTSSGPVGGPFSVNSLTYSLTNTGTAPLTWSLGSTSAWLTASGTGGTLSPGGASATVTLSLNSAAFSLPLGVYSSTVTFSNLTSRVVQSRLFTLRVGQPDYYTEIFDSNANDLAYQTFTFRPDGSASFYSACREVATSFPTDPSGGTTVSLSDDSYSQVTLTGTNTVAIYGTRGNVFFIGSNGYITMGSGDTTYTESTSAHFNRPRVSALFDDLYPSANVSWKLMTNRVAVTYSNVRRYGASDSNNFQIELFFDGTIRLTYLRVDDTAGLAGLSAGSGIPSGFQESDFSSYGLCAPPLIVLCPANASEGDGVLSGAGQVRLPFTVSTNLTVSLASSDITEVTVPATVTVPAGQTNATFDITVVDDTSLDGTQTASISASAPGLLSGTATISILDNETAILNVDLPQTATEGQGTVQGVVWLTNVPTAAVPVSLSSSDTTEIQVPASVLIPAGQTSAVFTVTVVDDNLIDGPQIATVTAHVQNWTDGSAAITVLDNENNYLAISLPSQVSEGAGTVANGGQVSISGILPTNLVVSLASSDPARLTIPATVTIPSGQTSSQFNLTLLDNSAPDGSHPATVTATAPGFVETSGSTTILDDDADHFAFSVIPSPQVAFVAFAVTITAQDATNGTVLGFTGPLTLSAAGAHGAASLFPTNTGLFTAGRWTGNLTIGGSDSNIVLTASDGRGHTGASNPFDVVRPVSTFIPAASRVDMVPDPARGLLYISAGNQVLRYDLSSGAFLSPFVFGASLCGIDISPDNNTLIVADTSGYDSVNVWAYVVDLPTGNVRQALFPRDFYEGGTYTVAFGNDGAALISSTFLGSGWVPLRRYDPVTGTFATVASPRQNSMLSSSGDGRIIAIAEANISSGPLDRYDVASRTITGSVGDGWFNYEVGVNRDASQYAVPTYGGTFIYDTNLAWVATLGTYAGEGPIGLAYHPQGDLVFFAWWPSSFIRAYETHTLAEVARYDCGYNFGWTGNAAFGQGRLRTSRDGNNLFVTVSGGVRWIARPVGSPTDLTLNLSASPDPADAGNNLTYSITVSNRGPNLAGDARVFDRLPANVRFVSATSSQGTCALTNGLLTCTLGPLASGGSASVSIVVVPAAGGVLINTAAIVASAMESNPDDNSATIRTTARIGALGVTPAGGFASAGLPRGPFTPLSQTYTLTNTGDASLSWAVTKSANWLNLSATTGTLAPGATATVTVSLSTNSLSLPRGLYTDTILFTNLSAGLGSTTRPATLTVNSPPMALPQTVTVLEDSSTVLTLQGSDPDQDPFTAIISALPAHGTLYQTADGTTPSTPITSVPTTVTHSARKVIFCLTQHGYGSGYGNFQFKVNDGLADSGPASVTVNVTHVNHLPVPAPDNVAFLAGTAQVSFNVLSNDADVDNDPLIVLSFTSPARGTLAQVTNGLFTYYPGASFTNGQDQFTYWIHDGHGGTASTLVTIRAYSAYLDGGNWPTFGNGPSHTGYYPGLLGDCTFIPAWATNFGNALNQVAVGDGRVYVTPVTYFGATYLAAVDATTGLTTWRRDFTSAFSINPPTFDNGKVYVQRGDHSSDTQLWAINAADGSTAWSAPHAAQWERYYAPTVYGDGIWVDGGYYGGMYGFDTNGTQRFFYSALAQYDQWTPTYYQGTVYSWVEGVFTAHNPVTGARLWSVSVGWNWDGWSMNTVSAIDGGRAFVQQRPNLIAIDLAAHTNVWTATGGVTGSPAVANGVVYAILGNKVNAYAAQDGTLLGTYQATASLGGQPIVTDDALLVASSSATYVFNLASRQLVQTIPYGGALSVANRRLFIAGQDGWLRSYTVSGNAVPATLAITPSTGFIANGQVGGPFIPSSQIYTLTNTGDSGLSWSAAEGAAWLDLSATGGMLPARAATNVTLSLNAGANTLAAGTFTTTLAFSNLTNGRGTTNWPVTLTIASSPVGSLLPPLRIAGGFRLRFHAVPGYTCTLQRAPTPTGPWTPMATVTADSTGLAAFDDINPLSSAAFYRVAYP